MRSRPQPPVAVHRQVMAGFAAAVTITALALLTDLTTLPLLAAVFGASCVLVFTLPDSPLSAPANVIGGHLICAATGLVTAVLLPAHWSSMAIAVGMATTLMAALRMTHPPAGGHPIVILTSSAGWEYLLAPVLLGATVVVCCAWLTRVASTHLTHRSAERARQ